MQKKSICFVMDYHYKDKVGGAEVQAWQLAREFAKRNFTVTYITQSLTSSLGESYIDGVTVYRMKHKPLFGIFNFFRLNSILNQISPDVCYQRIASSYTGLTSHWCKNNNCFFIYACPEDSSCEKQYFTKSLNKLLINNQYNPNFFKKNILKLSAYIKNYLYEYGLKNSNIVLSQNDKQYHLFNNNFSIESKIMYSGHTVPTLIKNNKNNKKIILYIGILGDRKQSNIFPLLAQKNKQLNFVMAGYGEKKFEDLMLKYNEEVTNFSFLGKVTFKQSLEMISKAYMVINLSKPDREGLPNVFIQSWLRGVPIVSLNTNPDSLLDAQKFGICTNGSFDKLSVEINKLINNESYRDKLGYDSYIAAKQKYDIKIVTKQLIDLLPEKI